MVPHFIQSNIPMKSDNIQIYENTFSTIDIPTKDSVIIVDQFRHGKWTKTIHVGEWSSLTYLLLMKEDVELNLHIESTWSSAHILVKALIVADHSNEITLKAHAHLKHDHAEANLHLMTFLKEWAKAEIDGGVDLHPNVKKVAWHLLEENIVLWKNIQIKTLPMLDVRSNDVSASHGARIEKLDEKKLFYMRSKWLSEAEAKRLMLEWYVKDTFQTIVWSWEDLSDKLEYLQNNVIKEILR